MEELQETAAGTPARNSFACEPGTAYIPPPPSLHTHTRESEQTSARTPGQTKKGHTHAPASPNASSTRLTHCRSTARHTLWNVPAVTEEERPTPPGPPPTPSPLSRVLISRAALMVKVTASTCRGRAPSCLIRYATRCVSTRVLPDPGPASRLWM